MIARIIVDTTSGIGNCLPVPKKRMCQQEAIHKLKAMKPGDQFTVETSRDRATLLNAANTLRMAGTIEFQLITRKIEDGFLIVASAV